jgi:hypothetical protein
LLPVLLSACTFVHVPPPDPNLVRITVDGYPVTCYLESARQPDAANAEADCREHARSIVAAVHARSRGARIESVTINWPEWSSVCYRVGSELHCLEAIS